MRIFLSHSSRNKSLVREFRGMLPGFLNTWLDEDSLTWGENVPAELRETIQSSADFLIIFLDKEALNSKWVKQELEWAIQREKELMRTFILPILLPKLSPKSLPGGFSERLFLRLTDFTHSAVENIAKQATLKLFQLVVESYSNLLLNVPCTQSLQEILSELTAKQTELLAYLVELSGGDADIPQIQIEDELSQLYGPSELYYRLEALTLQGFLSKRRLSTAGFVYSLTERFRSLIPFGE